MLGGSRRLDCDLIDWVGGDLSPDEAIKSGKARFTGNHDLLERFVEVFRIPPAPSALPA